MASSKASIAGHPIHPMLIVFPIGLWLFGLACQIVNLAGGDETWRWAGVYCLGGGSVGAILAAVPGLIDLLTMPASRARTIGIWHMALNLAALALFVVAFFLLLFYADQRVTALVLSIIGAAVLAVSGWLGGDMVYRHGVAVEQEAFERKQDRMAAE